MAVPPVFSGLRHPERSQRERTRREDRHFKFYEIPDNLMAAHQRGNNSLKLWQHTRAPAAA
jgi:hypothetical protein